MSGNHSGEHHPEPQPYAALRTKAIESLLVEKGLISTDAIDARVQAYEQDIGPLNGAKVVARAWTDAEFKARLLSDGTSVVGEMGFFGAQGAEIVALENTPEVHNVVVCTLCSCYPWPVLGLPPRWYKSDAYRARVVIEPRAVLREFGLTLDESVEVRVWGQQLGHPLHGAARTPRRHRRLIRRRTRATGNARQHDRRSQSQIARPAT